MESDAVQSKVEKLRARQTQWLKERQAELERASVVAELRAEEHPVQLPQAPLPPPQEIRPEDAATVINRLTQRITDRLRVELQAELQKESAKARVSQQNEGQKLEGYLAKEIESHTCPICYELMVPPKHAPVLLFPCGHSFCTICISSHMHQHGKSHCPCCRIKIDSKAANIALQQLIQSFVARRDKVRKGVPSDRVRSHSEFSRPRPLSPTFEFGDENDEDAANSGIDDDESRLQREREMLSMRCRVLRNELTDAQAEEAAADAQLCAIVTHLQQLRDQEAVVSARLAAVQAELAGVQEQVMGKQGALAAADQQRQAAAARADLIRRTLEPLAAEVDKVTLLMAALGADSGDQLKDKMA